MDATIRATCPNCQSSLKIPAQWAGQPVKCKKCGAVVRTKGPAGEQPGVSNPAPLGGAGGYPVDPHAGAAAPFADFNRPPSAGVYNPFEGEPAAPAHPVAYDPNGYYPPAPNGAYPVPTGYPYPIPPGYQAAIPPGYPYPLPPGYGPPPGYAPAPGYEAPPQGYGYPQPGAVAPGPYPQAQPIPYPAAAPMAPSPVPPSSEFKPSEAAEALRGPTQKYQHSGGTPKLVWIGVALVLTAGLVFGGVYAASRMKPSGKHSVEGTGRGNDKSRASGGSEKTAERPGLGGNFPRRLLFIHVSNYLYLNPLTSQGMTAFAKGGDLTKGAASRLAYEWRVPNDTANNQLYLVSDTAPQPDGRNPMRPVIIGAYEKFFDTSRSQDRIVVYFGGHVMTRKVDDKDVAYLIPMDGDPDEVDTLIPLADFYAKLGACPATQKVVIWDVCRFNPERGRQRPGSEPMTEEVAAALAAAPAGVQVVMTCSPGENALEFYNLQPDGPGRGKFVVAGSNFLEATRYVAGRAGAPKNLGPNDLIPVEDWVKAIGKRVADVASNEKAKQTLTVVGGPAETHVAFKAEEPPALRFDLPVPPKGALAGDIAGELTLPGIQSDEGESAIGNFPFAVEALAPFAADVSVAEIQKPDNAEKYQFRLKVLDAFQTIRDVWGKKDGDLRDKLALDGGKVTDQLKKEILEEQRFPATAITKLERAIILLEAEENKRASEPKRWQAHYDYALAQCKARIAYLQEYNLALGNIRTEVLPTLDPKKGQDGYRLISSDKLKSGKKEQAYAKEAKELFEKMATDYKGTPWAVQAKRDRGLSLGLQWQPFSFKSVDMKD